MGCVCWYSRGWMKINRQLGCSWSEDDQMQVETVDRCPSANLFNQAASSWWTSWVNILHVLHSRDKVSRWDLCIQVFEGNNRGVMWRHTTSEQTEVWTVALFLNQCWSSSLHRSSWHWSCWLHDEWCKPDKTGAEVTFHSFFRVHIFLINLSMLTFNMKSVYDKLINYILSQREQHY